ncbi:MAG TPA: thioredoxin domain-containing protein [Kofleriaceae bacterium]|nr:thioredoxin domain-containing protein [Kofleriaceae bacterium]
MKTVPILLAALALAACQNDTKNLNDKIDKLDKKLDAVLAQRGGGNPGAAQQRPQRPEPDRSKTYSVSVAGDNFDGPADAKITVVKAYDYACPYCERVRSTMDELHKKYGEDIRVVYKQLVVHPQTAMTGALAFCAAGKQGKATQMDALIWDKGFKARKFDADQCWTGGTCEIVNAFAQELQLDLNKFKADMKGCQEIVQADMRDMQKLGVGATPAFFVNGRYISGAVPIDNFVTVIDEELKKANERIQQGTPKAQYYQQWVVDKGLKTLEAPKQ